MLRESNFHSESTEHLGSLKCFADHGVNSKEVGLKETEPPTAYKVRKKIFPHYKYLMQSWIKHFLNMLTNKDEFIKMVQ